MIRSHVQYFKRLGVGVCVGQQVVEINGIDVTLFTLDQFRSKLAGELGPKMVLRPRRSTELFDRIQAARQGCDATFS